MAVSAKKIIAFVGLTLLLAPAALAQDAKPDRCEGTLCDLWYANKGEPPKTAVAQPSAPTPLTTSILPAGATALTTPSTTGGLFGWFKPSPSSVPQSPPATASNSYMHLGGGGVLGGSNERCSGTVCDLYYHGSPPEEATSPTQQASAGAAMAAPVEAPVVHRHILHESETRPKCSSPNADPWRCYR